MYLFVLCFQPNFISLPYNKTLDCSKFKTLTDENVSLRNKHMFAKFCGASLHGDVNEFSK